MTSQEAAPETPPRLPVWAWFGMVLAICAAGAAIAYGIVTGMASRVQAAASLKREALDMAIPSVTVVHPKRGAPVEEVVLPGNAQAYVATPIWARTSGYLKTWYFDIGAHVKAKQLLAEIETPELDKQLEQARADLATAEANYDLAQSTATRYQTLLKTDSVARQDVEDRVGDFQAKRAMVESAKFNLQRLEQEQDFEKVYAPFDGVITQRNIDIGALINAGANAPGKELFDMASIGRLRVYVNVSQQYSRDVAPGATADITQAEFPDRHFTGTIVRNAEAIDPASRTLLTEVDVDNPTGDLLPGAFLSVHLKLRSKITAVIVPVNTLIFRSAGMQVAIVRENKTTLTSIAIGRDYGTEVEVVSGLRPEDEIIENPSDSLVSGEQVRTVTKPVGGAAGR